MSGPIDWAGLMRSGMAPPPSGLGLAPDAFWRLTPVELRIMLGRSQPGRPLSRAGLAALLAAYPDGKGEDDDRDRDA